MTAALMLNENQRALLAAASEGDMDKVRGLLAAGTDPVALTQALIQASIQGHVEVMKLLLEAGADASGTDLNGNSAVAQAAHNNHADAVQLLLASGANVHQKGTLRSTALHLALAIPDGSTSDRSGVVELLLKAGADPNALNDQGFTPLGMAMLRAGAPGTPGLIRVLAAGGAQLDVQDQLGNTPLHKAAYDIQDEIVTILLDAGADVKKRNKESQTPSDVAARRANSFPADSSYRRRLLDIAAAIKAREKKHSLFGRRTG